MSFKELFITAIVIIFILFVLYEAIRDFRYSLFQKNMKVTDKCLFKTDSCWEPGRITAIFNETVIIEDEDGEAHGIDRTAVRPYSKIW